MLLGLEIKYKEITIFSVILSTQWQSHYKYPRAHNMKIMHNIFLAKLPTILGFYPVLLEYI